MDGPMVGLMNVGIVNVFTARYTNVYMDGRMDRRKDGCINAWMRRFFIHPGMNLYMDLI